jgi:hypothetical protein
MDTIRSFARKLPGLRRAYIYYIDFAEARRLKGKKPSEVFTEIYKENRWGSLESISGPGSSQEQAQRVAEELPPFFRRLGIASILDIPCGDFNWLKNADLSGIDYQGADIVEELVHKNNQNFRTEKRTFRILNLLSDDLPKVDLIFCRDCLVHFSSTDVSRALRNIARSGATYLLTTSFRDHAKNQDIVTGQWRPLNLEVEPFSLPTPISVINEGCTEGEGMYADKSLCLWRISEALGNGHEKDSDRG